jgi:hypothetical protein
MGQAMNNPTIKTPGTRLLDLLAGWGNFVDRDEQDDPEQPAVLDSGLDAYEIAMMYQEAAAEIMSLEGEAEVEAVQRWVTDRLLPALLRSSPVVAVEGSAQVAA